METAKEDASDGFCRLCAKQFTCKQVLDLKIHSVKCKEVMSILASINLTCIDFSSESNLGKAICLFCYDFLIKIQQFLLNVHKAQDQLLTISSTNRTEIMPTEMCFEQNISRLESDSKIEVSIKLENSDDYHTEHYKTEYHNFSINLGRSEKNIKTEYITIKPIPQVNDVKLDLKCSGNKEYKGKDSVVKEEFNTSSSCNVAVLPEIYGSISQKDSNNIIKRECEVKTEVPELIKNMKNVKAQNAMTDTQTTTSEPDKVSKTITKKQKVPKTKSVGKKTKESKTTKTLPGLSGYWWTCFQCTMKFESKEQLSAHLTEAHDFRFRKEPRAKNTPITEEHLTCKTCNTVFPTTAKLQSHDWHHHNPNRKRKYPCYKCGKEYPKYLLKLHLMEHDGIKPFVCQVCNMSFVNDIRLRLHEKVHSNLRPYACTECDKTFRSKQTLLYHGRIHSGEMPYTCRHCGKRFRNSTNLTSHERIHTGVYPFTCKHCDRTFSCWGNCNKHMQRIHNATIAKTKGTPQGKFPLDPNTGEVIKPSDLDLEEWQKQVMEKEKKRVKTNKTA